MARIAGNAVKSTTHRVPRNRSSRGSILFASGAELGEVALRRAAACARARKSELHVLRVLAPLRADVSRRRPRDTRDGAVRRLLDQCVACHRTTLHVYRQVVDSPSAHSRIHVRVGQFVETVERCVAQLEPDRVFMPADLRDCGMTATRLVHAIGRPVCVVRGIEKPRRMVVTTDLRDPHYPVLQEAARLANQHDARIVAVHSQRRHADSVPEQRGTARRRLFHALTRVGLAAENVVVRAPLAARTILKEARLSGADIVLIGTRARSDGRLRRCDVAPTVIDQARTSVLVMPLPEAT